jgi:hypothetical protein
MSNTTEQNIIGLAWDLEAFSAQTKAVIEQQLKVYDLSKKISEQEIKPGSMGGFTELKQKVDITEKLRQEQDKLIASQTKLIASNKEVTASLEANITARIKLTNSLNRELAIQKEDLALLKQGIITRDEYNKRLLSSSVQAEKYKSQIASLNTEIRSQTKSQSDQVGAYKILSDQYNIAKKNAQDLAATFGVNSKEAKLAAASALALNAELQSIDKTVGLSQRNVGNYGSALKGVWGWMRNLANIIPGLGIGGVFLAAIYPLTELFRWLTKTSDATKEMIARNKLLNDVYAEADKNASKELTSLKILYEGTQNVTLSIKERTKAALFLQKTYPDTFKNFTTEQILLGQAKNGYDALTASILKTALASAAKGELDKLAAQRLEVEFTKQKILNATEREAAAAKDKQIKANLRPGEFDDPNKTVTLSRAQQLVTITNRRNAALDEQDKLLAKITQKEKFIIDLVGAKNLIDEIIGKPAKDKVSPITKESTKEKLDVEFELYKIAQQRKIKLLNDAFDDEKKSAEERLQLSQQITDAQIEFIDKQTSHDIKADQDKLKAQESNLKKAKGTERNNLIIEIENTKNAIKLAKGKADAEVIALTDDVKKRTDKINADEFAKREKMWQQALESLKNILSEEQAAIEAYKDKEIATLDQALNQKIITDKDYKKAKEKLITETAILSLRAQQKELEGELSIAQARGQNLSTLQNKISAIKSQIVSLQNKPEEKDKKDNKALYAQIEQDAVLAYDFVTGLVRNRYETELNYIQQLMDANNAMKEQEVANINASTLSSQEKAAELIRLEARTTAENARLAREQAAVRRREAIFDRDIAVVKIAGETAYQAIKAGYPLGLAIAAAGALQIALLLSKPIPAYGDGTDSHPGGPMIVGEKPMGGGYEPELVTEPGGRSFITTKPMLMNAVKGTKVKPLGDSIDNVLYAAMIKQTAGAINSNDELTKELIYGNRAILAAIKGQKAASTTIIIDPGWNAHLQKTVVN